MAYFEIDASGLLQRRDAPEWAEAPGTHHDRVCKTLTRCSSTQYEHRALMRATMLGVALLVPWSCSCCLTLPAQVSKMKN